MIRGRDTRHRYHASYNYNDIRAYLVGKKIPDSRACRHRGFIMVIVRSGVDCCVLQHFSLPAQSAGSQHGCVCFLELAEHNLGFALEY